MRPNDLARELYRNLHVLAGLSLVFLVVLALAPLKWQNTEWRRAQREYNRQAETVGLPSMTIGLQQIWRPEIGLTDRCISCHVGMGASKPIDAGEPLFAPHPEIHHNTATMGCTVCHRGQGLATTQQAAHGNVHHFEDPMLPVAHLEASCGGCHAAALRTPPASVAEHGAYLFQLHGCQACHLVDGEGGDVGPDLSGVALKGFDRAWHIRHLLQPSAVVEDSQMMSFGHLRDDEIDAILAYLDTLIGAPRLVRGKAIAVEQGCRGCHVIDGLGGDVSVDLNEAASKSASEYDFSGVEGEHSVLQWHREHLRHPLRVAPGSTMPAYLLAPEDEAALLTYILSLRPPPVPQEQLPAATVLARLEGQRDFKHDGAVLFGALCAACHGVDARGQVMPELGTTVPDLRNPDTAAVLSRSTLRSMIEHGRPGRNMPAWGAGGAGLRDDEIDALVTFLRPEQAPPSAPKRATRSRTEQQIGSSLFQADCAACHGIDAEGSLIAPSLRSPELLFAATDEYLTHTIGNGRPGTAMPAHRHYDAQQVTALVSWIRAQGAERLTARRRQMGEQILTVLGVADLDDYRAVGSPAFGARLYAGLCSGCHGLRGRGGLGPAIANADFLRSAGDGFLAATMVLGREGMAMRSFGPRGLVALESREVGDLIVYLKQLAASPDGPQDQRTAQGIEPRGAKLFTSYCAGCHGDNGGGLTAPALRNPMFLDAVSDGFLQATIVRGRPGTAMRAWGSGGFGFAELDDHEINDIVAHIRSWQVPGP